MIEELRNSEAHTALLNHVPQQLVPANPNGLKDRTLGNPKRHGLACAF